MTITKYVKNSKYFYNKVKFNLINLIKIIDQFSGKCKADLINDENVICLNEVLLFDFENHLTELNQRQIF